ncbi:hypothetical protein SLS62_004196 [Diatrype stigma]|uniref:Uncharacterized protein n=1 Tax=Diatrype stigma TaxID=117547 RepID=A0AAN9YTX0_9PEZI
MGKKRGIDQDDTQSRKKPAPYDPYNPRSPKASAQKDEDSEYKDIPQRFSNLHLRRTRYPITKSLHEFVKRTGRGQYEFSIPFHKLAGFHRIEWGVENSAKSILVRLEFLYREKSEYVGFCVHLLPGNLESKSEHTYCATDVPWKGSVACNTESNFLTDTLSQKLHEFLGQKRQSAKRVYDKIVEVASSNPAAKCYICAKALPCKVFRPLPCGEACRKKFKELPLTTRLSPFLRDPAVLDFLLCCLASTTWDQSAAPQTIATNLRTTTTCTTLPPTCPVGSGSIKNVLDSFPAISSGITVSMLLGPRRFQSEREDLLDWLCSEFDGTLVTAPKSARISEIPGDRQFLLLNSNIERQTTFDKEMRRSRIPAGGFAGFHGTPPENLFNIFKESMKSPRNIFYANEPVKSTYYVWKNTRGALGKWKNSAMGDVTALLGVEVAVRDLAYQGVEANSSRGTVMVRNVFLLPSSRHEDYQPTGKYRSVMFPTECRALPSMQNTYTQIKSGDLIKAMEKQGQDEEKEGA